MGPLKRQREADMSDPMRGRTPLRCGEGHGVDDPVPLGTGIHASTAQDDGAQEGEWWRRSIADPAVIDRAYREDFWPDHKSDHYRLR